MSLEWDVSIFNTVVSGEIYYWSFASDIIRQWIVFSLKCFKMHHLDKLLYTLSEYDLKINWLTNRHTHNQTSPAPLKIAKKPIESLVTIMRVDILSYDVKLIGWNPIKASFIGCSYVITKSPKTQTIWMSDCWVVMWHCNMKQKVIWDSWSVLTLDQKAVPSLWQLATH